MAAAGAIFQNTPQNKNGAWTSVQTPPMKQPVGC